MPIKIIQISIVSFSILISSSGASLQKTVFKHLETDEGRSMGNVTSIYKDSRGFMWFGTDDGLNKYDGYDYTVYRNKSNDPNSITDIFINSIIEVDEKLFVGASFGFNVYDRNTDKFTRYYHDPNDPDSLWGNGVISLFKDSKDRVWIGTEKGLCKFDYQTEIFEAYPIITSSQNTAIDCQVMSIVEDDEGYFWLSTNMGLYQFYPETSESNRFIFDEKEKTVAGIAYVNMTFLDSNGDLFIGTNSGGMYIWERATGRIFNYRNDPFLSNSISANGVSDFLEDENHNLWIATINGLSILPENTVHGEEQDIFTVIKKDHTDDQSLCTNILTELYADEENRIWIGGRFGAVTIYDKTYNQFNSIKFTNLGDEYLSNNMTAITEDKDGNIWFGADGGGIYCWNRVDNVIDVIKNDPSDTESITNNKVLALCFDSFDNLWIGMWDGGVDRYNLIDKSITHYKHDTNDPNTISSNSVFYIYEDKNRDLWLGTWIGGLNKYDREIDAFRNYPTNTRDGTGISDDIVTTIYEDKRNNLWIGTQRFGINKLERNASEFEYYFFDKTKESSISNNDINGLYEDSENRFWIATRTGLELFDRDNDNFFEFSVDDGISNSVIYGILESDDYLWLSTNNGLSRVKVSDNMGEPSIECRNFEVDDGLSNNQFNRWSYYKAKDGMLIFGGVDGITYFYPKSIVSNSFPPPVVITNFSIFNKTVMPAESGSPLSKHITESKVINLSHQDYVISFEYAALNYTHSSNNQYAYKLEGFDKSWNYVGRERKATYTNLDHGEYRFRVIAADSEENWNMDGASIKIIIRPPFYKTVWFIMLSIVFVIGVIVGFYRYRTGILKIRANKLEEIVRDKTINLITTNESLKNQIIERKNVEKDLQKSREKYRYLIENINEVIFSTDDKNVINYISPAINTVLEYKWNEMINNDLKKYIYSDDLERFVNHKEKILENESVTNEFRLISKTGQLVWSRISEKVIMHNGAYAGTRGVLTNITERKLLENQLIQSQKLESIGQLAAGVAHEINTPTQYVGDNITFLKDAFSATKTLRLLHEELVRKIKANEDYEDLMDEIIEKNEALDITFLCEEAPIAIEQAIEGIGRITTIVKAMKEFSHPGTENRVIVNINELIKSTLIVTNNIWKYIAEVETDYTEDLPEVHCLPAQFNQVILNIIINATHAIEEKYSEKNVKLGLIKISTSTKDESVFIEISDNGMGIPEEIKDKIFNPFFTTKSIGKGTGQGLAIAHDIIVNKHKGMIDFSSVEGEGTTFTISLPLLEN